MLRRCFRSVNCGELLSCIQRIKFHSSGSRILFSSFDKDLPNPSFPTPLSKLHSPDSDVLLEQIEKAKTLDRILDLCSMHLDVMNAKHVVKSIDLIHSLARSSSYNSHELMQDKAFQGVCSRVMRVIRLLDSNDLISVLKSLTGLEIKTNSYVMQAVLKMIGSHLNDMSLGQLIFLNFLLSKQRHNPLVDGLRLALPLVLQVQIEQQLDSDNLTQVVDCFQLACRARMKPATIQKVLSTVLDKAKSLTPNTATTVIFALMNLDIPLNGYKELMNYSFEVISRNIETLDRTILPIIRLCANNSQYNSVFFYAVGDLIVSERWNLQDTYEVIRYFSKLSFCPPNLVDHFVSAICNEADSIRTSPAYSLLYCVEYLTLTGYKPTRIEEALQVFCSCEDKISALREGKPLLYMKFLSCLAMLGHFPVELLSGVLQEDFLFDIWSKSRKIGRGLDFEKCAFSLAWSLFSCEHNDLVFPPLVLKQLTQGLCSRTENESPLEKFLENGLGGSQFVKNKMFTRDGLLIDHIVAMRSGNYPVSLESTSSSSSQLTSFVEDLVLPTDARILAVIVAYPDQYCQDPENLKGWVELKIKCLLKKSCTPVVINYSLWKNLPDREKIPYLMQNIKQSVQVESFAQSDTLT